MRKHSKKVRSYALKSLIALAVLMMILSVVLGEGVVNEKLIEKYSRNW